MRRRKKKKYNTQRKTRYLWETEKLMENMKKEKRIQR